MHGTNHVGHPAHGEVRPPYALIADDLRSWILDGTLQIGGKLPSEADMVAVYGVSRLVVRAALETLRNDGLVDTRANRGSYVRDRRPSAAKVLGALASPVGRKAVANDDVGGVLRIARKALQLTQTDVSRRSGYSQAMICRAEQGKVRSQAVLTDLAATLSIPPKVLGLERHKGRCRSRTPEPDRTSWSRGQWVDDARAILADPNHTDGALLTQHVRALLAEIDDLQQHRLATRDAAWRFLRPFAPHPERPRRLPVRCPNCEEVGAA